MCKILPFFSTFSSIYYVRVNKCSKICYFFLWKCSIYYEGVNR
nr:MAG TPA: hypothetical protein [Caudoviricetes sp.]